MLLCSLSYSLKAQKIKFNGVIVNDSSGRGVEAASIHIRELKRGTQASVDGVYDFGEIAPGKYTIEISAIGYHPSSQVIQLRKEEYFTFSLNPSIGNLGGVYVEGQTQVKRVKESGFNVNAIDLTRISNTNSDLNQVLNRTTGIKIRESGGMGSDFSFSLNGFTGKQVRFFLDGIPIDTYGSSFTLNNLPVNIADRIEIYKGVVPLELGADALGGAINIITNKKDRNFLDAYYEIGSFNTHRFSVNYRKTNKTGFMFNVGAFANYSDNSYKVDVSVADRQTGAYGPVKQYKHFHDGYQSGSLLVEAGVRDKKYADYLLFGAVITGNRKEIQQGATMQRVTGDVFRTNSSLIPSFKYKKSDFIISGLSFQASGSYNFNENKAVDTSSKVYDWTGTYGYRNFAAPEAGELGDKTIYVYNVKDLQLSGMLRYDINARHFFVLNDIYSGYNRKEHDEVKSIRPPGKPALNKNVAGLSYNFRGDNERLIFSLFGKMYNLSTSLNQGDTTMIKAASHYSGYGVATSYRVSRWLLGKVSFEKAYRLPSADELLGDGLLQRPNSALLPESGKNVNVGIATNWKLQKHRFGIESNFIYRNVTNLIQNVVTGFVSTYQNQNNIRITGVDGQLYYNYDSKLTVEMNATYQKSVNINRYDPPGTQVPNYLYDAQLPNVPIFYGNADITYRLNSVFKKTDNLTFNVGLNHIDAFYLNWPVYGNVNYKKAIPQQFTQNVSVAYALLDGKYTIRAECRNLTDEEVFDYYLVQKPGRSFSLRFRYSLK